MPRVLIDDLADPRIAPYRNLKATNQTRGRDGFVVEGEKLVERLLESHFPAASILVSDRHEARISSWAPDDVPLLVVPHALVDVLVGFNFHQGVLACGIRRPWPSPGEIAGGSAERRTFVACPQIDNPENLGAIIRLGDVFGVDAILVGGRCPDPFSRRVLRVSMGMALRLPVIESEDLAADLARLRSDFGFKLAATVVDTDARPLHAVRRPDRLALLLGCEGQGLGPEWVDLCDLRVTIPMRPGAESLNVAVAAGILLYHFTTGPAGAVEDER
ncbi:TrmH family RNA methyltransferase [Singulisphaera sp. PoT]|uniref:TrmH family RNA methyltransferase n=1 Tax=Singulisphaera sp. PoT TaxID=3411797 RepID=UPI003BF53ED1